MPLAVCYRQVFSMLTFVVVDICEWQSCCPFNLMLSICVIAHIVALFCDRCYEAVSCSQFLFVSSRYHHLIVVLTLDRCSSVTVQA